MSDPPPPDPLRLLEDVRSARLKLLRVEDELRGHSAPPDSNEADVDPLPFARSLLEARRMREEYFPTELLREPAWDMLLALYIAQREGRTLKATEASKAARIPYTSWMRLVDRMEAAGLIERREVAEDTRLVLVNLTPETNSRIAEYLRRVGAAD